MAEPSRRPPRPSVGAGPAWALARATPRTATHPAGRTATWTHASRPAVRHPASEAPASPPASACPAATHGVPAARPSSTSAAANDARSAADSAR